MLACFDVSTQIFKHLFRLIFSNFFTAILVNDFWWRSGMCRPGFSFSSFLWSAHTPVCRDVFFHSVNHSFSSFINLVTSLLVIFELWSRHVVKFILQFSQPDHTFTAKVVIRSKRFASAWSTHSPNVSGVVARVLYLEKNIYGGFIRSIFFCLWCFFPQFFYFLFFAPGVFSPGMIPPFHGCFGWLRITSDKGCSWRCGTGEEWDATSVNVFFL